MYHFLVQTDGQTYRTKTICLPQKRGDIINPVKKNILKYVIIVLPEFESFRTTDTMFGIGILCCTNDLALLTFSLADSSSD
jgi:hypothetical protein